ncbi:MAG: hypothetical protein RRY10_01785 [Christensenellaceae bacterium]
MRKIKILKILKNLRFLLEWSTFVSIIALVVTFALTAGMLPAKTLVQSAEPSGLVLTFGMGTVLLALFLTGSGISGLFFLLSRFPRLYKYPVKITAENIEAQYHLAKILLCAAQIISAIVFCNLMRQVYNMTITLESAGFRNMLIAALVAFGIEYLIYFLVARRYR